MPGTTALIAAIAPIIVGILGLIGTRWVAAIQNKARENEQRLRAYEAYDHTYLNLRADYDRVAAENAALRADLRRVRAERDAERDRLERRLRDLEGIRRDKGTE